MSKILLAPLLCAFFCLGAMCHAEDTLDRPFYLQEIEVAHYKIKDTLHSKAHASVTTEDMLSRMPEIQMLRRGAFAMEPTIRSYSAGQIQINLDGIRIQGACTDRMDPATSYIEPINLESIQSHTTEKSGIYGGNTGGAIALTIRQPVINPSQPVSVQFTNGLGLNNLHWSKMGALNVSSKRGAVRLSGVHRKAQNYLAGGNLPVSFSQFEKYNLLVSSKYLLTDCSYLRNDVIVDRGLNIGYPALPMDVSLAQSIAVSLEHNYMPCRVNVQNIRTKVYYSKVYHEMDDSHRPNPLFRMYMPGWSHTYGVFNETNYRFSDRFSVSVRPEAYLTYAKAEMLMVPNNGSTMYMLTWPDNERHVVNTWAQLRHKITSTTFLYLGGRFEYTHTAVKSSLGSDQLLAVAQNAERAAVHFPLQTDVFFTKSFANYLHLKTYVGYRERAPNVTELLGFYLFNAYDGYDQIGNYELKKERVWHSEQQVMWNTKAISAKVNVYYDKIYDFILAQTLPANEWQPMTPGANGVRKFDNVPSANIWGFEAQMQISLFERLRYIHTSRYSRGWFDTGDNLPLVAPWRNIHLLRFGNLVSFISAECEWAAPQVYIHPNYGDRYTPSFAILNARATHSIRVKRRHLIQASAGVENILDQKYREHQDWGNIFRPGRNVYVNLSYAF